MLNENGRQQNFKKFQVAKTNFQDFYHNVFEALNLKYMGILSAKFDFD